jgi:hypothetical protein
MPRRSKKIQEVVSAINELLKLDNMYITLEDGSMSYLSSSNPKAQLFKQGICEALERVLRKTDSYKGYRFLDHEEFERSKRFDREYF